jgi:hypothetical protein
MILAMQTYTALLAVSQICCFLMLVSSAHTLTTCSVRALLGLGMLIANNQGAQLELASHPNIKDLMVSAIAIIIRMRECYNEGAAFIASITKTRTSCSTFDGFDQPH